MSVIAQFADILVQRLSLHGFSRDDWALPASTAETILLKTERRRFTRYVCVVVNVPSNVKSANDVRALQTQMRHALSRHYAQFPWYKELGTFSIYLCEPTLFSSLHSFSLQMNDKTGLHINVMLAAWIVNATTFEAFGGPTWGLLSRAGQTVGAISGALAELRSRHIERSRTA